MCRSLAMLILCLLASTAAQAGAWLREEGKGFISASATVHKSNDPLSETGIDYKSSVYAELGITPSLTMGFDLNERPGLAGHALLFSRFPLVDLGEAGRLAGEIGVGGHHGPDRWHPMYKFTLSYGFEFDSRWGSGWLALDGAIEDRTGAGRPFYKLDLTTGLSEQRMFNPLLQIETTHIQGAPVIWTVTPSVIIQTGEQNRWVVGLENRSNYPKGIGLKIALWRDF